MTYEILASPRPWVVCDWGALRALPANAVMPTQCSIVLSDQIYLEVVDADSDHRDNWIRKLNSLLAQPGVPDRVLMAVPWPKLAGKEWNPYHRPRGRDLIDTKLTEAIRTALHEKRDWVPTLLQGRRSSEFADYLRHKQAFVSSCNAFADQPAHKTETGLKRLRDGGGSIVDWIRDPSLTAAFGAQLGGNGRYDTRAWKREFAFFPDRTPMGRLLRIISWYGMLRGKQRGQSDAEFSNNYEDSLYAFIASYMYSIATKDNGLIKCIAAIFPKIKVFGQPPFAASR